MGQGGGGIIFVAAFIVFIVGIFCFGAGYVASGQVDANIKAQMIQHGCGKTDRRGQWVWTDEAR